MRPWSGPDACPRAQLAAGRGVPLTRRPRRAPRRVDRAARLPLARDRQHPRRARLGRGRRAAGRARAAGAALRPDAVVRGVPGQPDAAARDLSRGAARPARLAPRPGLPALPRRQRPRGQRRRRLARARMGDGAPGRAGDLPQLVVERARARGSQDGRPRPEPRQLVRELPMDAAARRRAAAGAQAAAPRGRLPRRLAGGRTRAARRRRLRRRLRAARRAGRGGLARRRRGSARAARERMAVDPLAVFHEWFEAAREAGVEAPETMTLATADAAGRPSARMLLLKSADERGFTFFTGYESRKGRELAENPRAALVFYWRPLGRQVRGEGSVRRPSAAEAGGAGALWAGGAAAFGPTRPPRSGAAAAASRQGEPIESREALEAEFER